MDSDDKETLSGCLVGLWALLVTGPIWFVLMFQILLALGDSIPGWCWGLYWVYVPASIVGILFVAIGRVFMGK